MKANDLQNEVDRLVSELHKYSVIITRVKWEMETIKTAMKEIEKNLELLKDE